MIAKELINKFNPRYGRVISIKIDDSDIFDKPLLLTHQGLGMFKV